MLEPRERERVLLTSFDAAPRILRNGPPVSSSAGNGGGEKEARERDEAP